MMKKSITMGALMAALAAGALQAQTGSTGTNTQMNTNTGINAGASTGVQVDTNVRDTTITRETTTQMPAVSTPNTVNGKAPVAGANSFTQSQVMTRLSRAGYTNIASLQKGSDGVWRGTGVKDGTTHSLTFDYQGNIGNSVN